MCTEEHKTLNEFIAENSKKSKPEIVVEVTTEELEKQTPYGGRCEKCTAPDGVICDFPGESPGCPIHAGQS